MKNLDIDFKISGTKIFIPFKAICTITNEEFEGKVIIEYFPDKKILEYMSVENFIEEKTKNKLIAEELANLVFLKVKETINPKYLKVLIDVIKSKAHKPVQVWIEE